jgi:hypothetical protein
MKENRAKERERGRVRKEGGEVSKGKNTNLLAREEEKQKPV